MGSAYIRAAHVRYDPPPWILRDELALQLLSDRYVAPAHSPDTTARSPRACGGSLANESTVNARSQRQQSLQSVPRQRGAQLLGNGLETSEVAVEDLSRLVEQRSLGEWLVYQRHAGFEPAL